MRVSDFHFDLPEDLIAQHPPEVRGTSRMLVLNRAANTLTDAHFADLPSLLQPGDLLVLNDSRVLPARLFATRAGLATQHNSPRPAGLIEILLTEQLPHPSDNLWRVLAKPARKVRRGETLLFRAPDSAAPVLTAEVVATGEFGERTLRFAPVPGDTAAFYEALARIGHMPLPPYIHRNQSTHADTPEDRARYQTVYSHQPGSAAAPTAGLHFTPKVLAALEARGVEIAYLTLHVGLGTFQPVRVSDLADIRLHSERYTLPPSAADALNRALVEKRRVIAVGTTTTRTLEHIGQELATGNRQPPTVVQPHSGHTGIFLAPGHRFRIVSGLLTNFHLPESTLLMLVAAFSGNTAGLGAPCLDSETWEEPLQNTLDRDDPGHGRQTILAAYAHAIHHRYRFYSYGDCMLLL